MPNATIADRGSLDFKSEPWEVKALDDSGEFEVYMACFGNIDRGGDVIDAGSFKNLADYAHTGWIGVNHDMDELPVAYPISATQDGKGLLIRGRFHSHEKAQACRTVVKERMAAGKAVTGSIGYKVEPGGATQDYVDGKSVRRIRSLSVYESSFVNLPMNPRAEALSAKSLEGLTVEGKVMTVEDLKAWLEQETKAGRVLSKANHATIKTWHGTLSKMCGDMKSLVDQFDPEKPDDEPDGDEKGGTGIQPTTGDMKEGNPRNTAGNAIPATQNPRGAVIAADIPGKSLADWQKQKQAQLDALRARVLQDQFRFARS